MIFLYSSERSHTDNNIQCLNLIRIQTVSIWCVIIDLSELHTPPPREVMSFPDELITLSLIADVFYVGGDRSPEYGSMKLRD